LGVHGPSQGGLAATSDLAAFLVSMIAPVKKSVNHLRILPSMRATGKSKHVLYAIFCPGFAFDLITLYSLLAIFNDSSETIRTKGMKDQLCAIFLVSVVAFLIAWRGFAASRRFYIFAVVIQGSLPSIFTPTNYSSLIAMENSDVELFLVCNYISRSFRT